MRLPEEFCRKMKELLGGEYNQFIASYQQPRMSGLRVNTLKISPADFVRLSSLPLQPIPWTRTGFYFSEEERPGKHPYYHAGLYYLQEPSAMVPAEILGIAAGDRVLDLCAAPGGKSTQTAAYLAGTGLLVSNDISAARTKPLVKNLDLCGAQNAVVTNEYPERLANKLPGYFNKLIIDAPCSGEGMFRKDPDAIRQWEIHSGEKCIPLQRDILYHAARLLSPGGKMVYSTCTFNPDENEGMIAAFLAEHPEFSLSEIPLQPGFDRGRPDWAGGNADLAKTVRIWPHHAMGEGHFAAVLEKADAAESLEIPGPPSVPPGKLTDFFRFAEENLCLDFQGRYLLYGEYLYLQPWLTPDLAGINVIRPGMYLGTFKKNRFEPSHSLAMALKKENFQRVLDLSVGDSRLKAYLKGETVISEGDKGWTMVCVQGFPLGWAKQVEGILKNHYPKGWRDLD